MKKLTSCLPVLALVLLGFGSSSCYLNDEAITENTEVVITALNGEYIADLMFESEEDHNTYAFMDEDILTVQRLVFETVLSHKKELKALKSPTIFIAHNAETFLYLHNLGGGASDAKNTLALYTSYTTLDNYIILVSPQLWTNPDRNVVAETMIHENGHFVSEILDGDPDSNHSDPSYWGKNGLVSIVLNKWLKLESEVSK